MLTPPTMLCIYPTEVLDRMQAYDDALRYADPGFDPDTAEFFAVHNLAWDASSSVSVAFLGGSTVLHEQIAVAAATWTQYANIKFDFGVDIATGTYRTWTRSDAAYSADIRITFDEVGYWSTIGRQSNNAQVAPPNEPSMSLAKFDTALPADWEQIVLHEFGHALGFKHEHQHPAGDCDIEYRWWDDPGYVVTPLPNPQNIPCVFAYGDQLVVDDSGKRPGLYRIMGGYPNYWSICKIDHNLRQLEPSSAFLLGPYDENSIMKYHFPAFMYQNGDHSPCYSGENAVLSDGDKAGAAMLYPHEAGEIENVASQMVTLLDEALSFEAMRPEIQEYLETQRARFARE